MPTSFAALVFRSADVSDALLAERFAVALAGWDAPNPTLSIAPLPGVPGHVVAFYSSGLRLPRGAEDEDFELACDLFEDELSPAIAVLDGALDAGHDDARVYAITYSEEILHDDAWRFDARGFQRRFVREGELGPEAGQESEGGAKDVPLRSPAGDASDAAIERAARPLRGSTFLSSELGVASLPALMGALYSIERRVPVRLAEPGPAAIAAEVERLNQSLKRSSGRGAAPTPASIAGRATPPVYEAFVRAYDWNDPRDPRDLYRELSIGAIEGTLRFLRPPDLERLDGDAAWANHARAGLFPIGEIVPSALGAGAANGETIVALAGDDDRLVLVPRGRRATEAGPTFGELIRYLALGWSARGESEEDMIGALMLRAKMRCAAPRGS